MNKKLAILSLCEEWYNLYGEECGGKLHCILDDRNVLNGDLEYDIKLAIEEKYENYKLALKILDGLKMLSLKERRWIVDNIKYYE